MTDNLQSIDLTIESCFKIENDFQNVFLSRSGIHVTPKTKQLKLSSRSINSTRYEDLYIIEPQAYYKITFKEKIGSFFIDKIVLEKVFWEAGLLAKIIEDELYIYNTTQNIVYIQKGMKAGVV